MPGVVEENDLLKTGGARQRSVIYSMHESQKNLTDMKGGSRNRYPNGYNSDQMSDVTDDDGPCFLLEHLATFSVGSEFVSPKDGLRRLLQMEKTSGIWTQKMQMKLVKNWVLILDYEDGDVVEKFPMNLISDPTACTSDDPRELYNNILVFIVREDTKNKNPNQSEMHIFQCVRVYAQSVVDEMKMFMSGKVKPKSADNIRLLPPPPHNPPPDPPVNGANMKVREQVAMFSGSGSSSSAIHPPAQRGSSVLQQRIERASGYARESNDETSSTTSDKYEREVTILNLCFDDIERFVVRLQHAAAAFKELERRQKSRKHKKKDMGDGMLSIRAKPPPEREFVEVLRKFKLSFNLLAKLKSHIHDPNAPELIHFLFTPLALIIDAARDSIHSVNLPANVVSPLLTRDAIELLANCCTSKETDLWHSLGDAWIIPREQWKGPESNYRPVFSNGWAPDLDSLEEPPVGPLRMPRQEGDLREQDYQRVFSHPERDSRYGSEYFGSERGEDPDRNESPGVIPDHHPHMRPYERPYEHMSPEDKETYVRRKLLDRGSALSPESDFHDPRDRDMRSEFSSDSIEHHSDLPLSPERQFDRQQLQWLDDLKSRRAKVVQVVYPRTANNEKELTVIRGEILEIIDDSRKWWKARNMRGQIAHVPHTIVTPYPAVDDDIFNNPVYGTSRSRENYYSTEGSPLKDPYPEGTTRSQETSRSPSSGMSRPAPADWIRRERQADEKDSDSGRPHSQSFDEDGLPLPSPPPEEASFSSPSSQEENLSPPNWLPPPPDVAIYTEPYCSLPRTPSNAVNAKEELQRKRSSIIRKKQMQGSAAGKQPEPPVPVRAQSLPDSRHAKNSADSVSLVSTDTITEMFQEELRASLAQKKGQKVWKKITCPEHHVTDCLYITEKSTRDEVEHWLEIKGFSERAREILKPMSTETLFNLKKSQLEKHLGSEGQKLHSNLLIQKNMCGYKTVTSEELKSILEERRQRVESL